MAGMTLEDLRNLIHREIDGKIDVIKREADSAKVEAQKIENARAQFENKLGELRTAAESGAETFWQTHGRVVLVAGCLGLILGAIVGWLARMGLVAVLR